MVKVTNLLIDAESVLGFSFEVGAWTKMKVWHIKGPKVVSSDQNLGFRGFYVRASPHFSSLQVTESYAGAWERGFISPIICHSELPVYAEISCRRQYSSMSMHLCIH